MEAAAFGTSIPGGILFGIVYGIVFALCFGKRTTSPGAGLIWGLAFAFLIWIVLPTGILSVLSRGQ